MCKAADKLGSALRKGKEAHAAKKKALEEVSQAEKSMGESKLEAEKSRTKLRELGIEDGDMQDWF